MNDAIKKRLVGAAVILIFAGLLWPILFDFDESMKDTLSTIRLPEKPVNATLKPLPADTNIVANNQLNTVENTQQSHAAVNNKPPEVKKTAVKKIMSQKNVKTSSSAITSRPMLDENRIPVSYVVQVGTFNRWNNADSLRNRLISNSLKAYVRPETSVQKGPYVVAVGPFMTWSKAEQALSSVKKKASINDAIIRYFRDI